MTWRIIDGDCPDETRKMPPLFYDDEGFGNLGVSGLSVDDSVTEVEVGEIVEHTSFGCVESK